MPFGTSLTLAPGFTVAQRFTLQRLAGRGGMGIVFQARDEHTGRPVALKLLQAFGSTDAARRFAREAEFLASLCHPGIVSYVAHGLADGEQSFLAMEWLEGEDLSLRLAKNPLSLAETLQLLRRAAEALAVAHSQGIIHRDIKPSNLFLCGGKVGELKLLDFGLARADTSSQAITGSQIVLGTPGYMAPEQASSQRELTPAADIFSLGCVLYECLTGQAPFRAPMLAAVLAKILFSEPVALRTLRPELPLTLQRLVEQMLAKDPQKRLADAGQLLRVLAEMEFPLDLPPPHQAAADPVPGQDSPAMPAEPAQSEQQLVSVLLATERSLPEKVSTLNLDKTAQSRQHLQLLLQHLRSHSAHAVLLADGSLLATFVLERGAATDQAALAAHCALFIKEHWAESLVALTTGLSLRDRPLPVGDAVDRAGELLHRQKTQPLGACSTVLVDDTTAGLLGPQFQLDKMVSGLFLLNREHASADASRPLLGRPTSCVGREQELALLELAFTTCAEDSSAHALLVTAPPGTGKSRLRHELLRRLERHARRPLVLLGRGDPMKTISAYGLVAQAVRQASGVVDGEPLEARQARLTQRLTRYLPAAQHKHTTEFLGELCAIPFTGEDSPMLCAAREDPQLMSTQVARALVTWLEAECAQGPVVLMLEDLHWSDGPSIHLVDEVLREMTHQPLMVLALARPEVKELFPGLWARHVQEVALRGLSQKASARLVHEVLGPQVPVAVVSRLVAQADGNVLFLEELIRGMAEGHGEETPRSVLAMLQSRLQRLEPKARRVVLAASIFGRNFWAAGVKALLEPAMSSEELARALKHLVEQEVVQVQPGSRFPGQAEYRFHHALVRDAAYSLVADGRRATGHLQAGEWLEAAGESEILVLAEHYKLGGQKQKAIQFFTRACKQICEQQRMDLQGAQRCLNAAFDCEPTGQTLTELQVLAAEVSFWMEDVKRAYSLFQESLPKLADGSVSWVKTVGGLIMMGAESGRLQEAAALGQRLMAITPAPEALAPYCEALAFLSGLFDWGGQPDMSAPVHERMAQVIKGCPERDNIAYGWWCLSQGYSEYCFAPYPWESRRRAEEGMQAFGINRNQLLLRTLLGQSLVALGEESQALKVMREGLEGATYFGRANSWLQMHMAMVLSGTLDPAQQEEARCLALHAHEVEAMSPLTMSMAPLVFARVALARGSPVEAETQARLACELLGKLFAHQITARVCLSAALLAQRRVVEARTEAEECVRALEGKDRGGMMAVVSWLTLAEACLAQGDDTAAESALRRAMASLRLRAEGIPEGAARERFLSQVPENARVLQLSGLRSL